MKLLAKDVQQTLDVQDGLILAYGYTYDRKSVSIYFRDGKLVREYEFSRDNYIKEESDYFESDYFFDGIKRFYLGGYSPCCFNQRLRDLFQTFSGSQPSYTVGGSNGYSINKTI